MTITFYRPAAATKPNVHTIAVYDPNEFQVPSGQPLPLCHENLSDDGGDNTDGDGTVDTTICVDDETTP